jgi:hypothetical protein
MFHTGDSCAKFRPPTTIRIEIDLIEQRLTVVWEVLKIKKEIPFPASREFADAMLLAYTAIKTLEKCNSTERFFVDGDMIQIWQVTEAGRVLVAEVEVSVKPLMCPDCQAGEWRPN